MNQYNAARAAGYPESTARDHTNRLERSVSVGMKEAFEQAGITDKFLANLAFEGLNATKPNGKPDWFARHKYMESVSKMTDRLKEKHEVTGKDGNELPTPLINIYVKNTSDRPVHTGESISNSRIEGQAV